MYAPICVTFVPKLFHQIITINRFVFSVQLYIKFSIFQHKGKLIDVKNIFTTRRLRCHLTHHYCHSNTTKPPHHNQYFLFYNILQNSQGITAKLPIANGYLYVGWSCLLSYILISWSATSVVATGLPWTVSCSVTSPSPATTSFHINLTRGIHNIGNCKRMCIISPFLPAVKSRRESGASVETPHQVHTCTIHCMCARTHTLTIKFKFKQS